MSDPNNETQDETPETPTKSAVESIRESIDFVVDMMNSGGANPDHVYPEGRYQGD